MKNKRQKIGIYSICIYVGIAYLLATKYCMRITPDYGYITITYLCIITCICLLLLKGKCVRLLSSNKIFWICFACFAVALLVVQYSFNPMLNNVDRWSALANPIHNLLHGEFPYLAKTHLGGYASPLPVWQIFHIPFYLLGNVGLSEIFTLLLFIMSVKCLYGTRMASLAMILLAGSINIWYEVSVRSDLISNFLLLATFVNVLYMKKIHFRDYPYLLSFIAGLWLSTRFSTAFPLYIMFISEWFVLPWKKKIIVPIISVVAFLLTLLPFVIWNADALFHYENNPFALQTRQGHIEDMIIYFIVATIMAIMAKTKAQYYLCSAVILIVIPVVSYGNRMIRAGELQNIFDAWCDITYLDAAIPFVIMAICSIVGCREMKPDR